MGITYLGYDDGTLRLQFEGGEVYAYFLVPEDVARQVEVAMAGSGDDLFFKREIKGVYPHQRVK